MSSARSRRSGLRTPELDSKKVLPDLESLYRDFSLKVNSISSLEKETATRKKHSRSYCRFAQKKWSCPLVELEDFERKVEGVRDYRLRDRGRDFIEIVGEIGWEMEKSDCKKNIEVRPVPS